MSQKSRNSSSTAKCINAREVTITSTLTRKNELNSKAVAVITKLIEDDVTEEKLLESVRICRYISQSHYQDLVQERALVSNCGYPLCSNKLGKVSQQQYHISLKYGKVFDISERKNFCSSFCFKASKYLENQFYSTPLWLSEEKRTLDIRFLSKSDNRVTLENNNTPHSNFSNIETDNISVVDHEQNIVFSDDVQACNGKDIKDTVTGSLGEPEQKLVQQVNRFKPIIKPAVRQTPLQSVEKYLAEWFTLDTVRFVLGHVEFSKRCSVCSKHQQLSKGVDDGELDITKHFDQLCISLDAAEKEDLLQDMRMLRETEEKRRNTDKGFKKMRVPSQKELCKDSELYQLKVKSYYGGKVDVLPVAEIATKHDVANLENNQNIGEDHKNHSKVLLPLVDSQAQNAHRRRIVLDKLNIVLPEIFCIMGLPFSEVTQDVRKLIYTFQLKANNIMLKPAEWTIVAIIIVKMLSIQSEVVKVSFASASTVKYIELLLKNVQRSFDYVDQLAEKLLDVNIY